jgi:hypothetical protein
MQCGISEAMEPQEETVGSWRVMRAGGVQTMSIYFPNDKLTDSYGGKQ